MVLKPRLEFMGLLVERDARDALALCFVLEEGEERVLLVLTNVVPVFFFKRRREAHGVSVVRVLFADLFGQVHDVGE